MKLLNRFKKILVVEDEAPLRHALVDKLSREGYAIVEANEGQTALRLALKEKPSLILLDLMLPGMDGMSILAKLREDEWGQNVTVFILTNLPKGDTLREQADKYKVKAYIEKSDMKIEDIVKKVKEVL